MICRIYRFSIGASADPGLKGNPVNPGNPVHPVQAGVSFLGGVDLDRCGIMMLDETPGNLSTVLLYCQERYSSVEKRRKCYV